MINSTLNAPVIKMANKIALRQFTNQLIKGILPSAISRNSFIVNDIPDDASLYAADENLVAHILNNLLTNTVGSSHNGCIRVSAKQEDNHIVICVKDNNNDYSRFISGKMTKVKPAVNKIGGDLSFEFNQRNSITILVSFTNRNVAA
jgi:nitrogen fixation/metabolism regulation signal transduction histidine kinase